MNPSLQGKKYAARHYQTSAPITVDINSEPVRCIFDDEKKSDDTLIYAPAFVDLQINGYGGVNFSDSDNLTIEAVQQVVETLWSHGVAYSLPTITTSSFENSRKCLEILSSSRQNAAIAKSIPGYHLEGPFISSIDGPRGAHPLEHTRPPSWDEFLKWQEAADGLIKLVTLAPELPGAIPFIEKLRAENIIPAIGHTNATTQDIQNAVDAGALLSTHLGNGAHAKIRRHPNYIWDQLANDSLWASFIVDGFHLPPNVVKAMMRAKGNAKSILVTDAVTIAGLPPGEYNVRDKWVELTEDGVVKLSGTDYLAGAALKMPDAIFNAAQFSGLDSALAINMASQHPTYLLEHYTDTSLDSFSEKTFTLLKWSEEELSIILTVIDGNLLFSQSKQLSESE